MRGIFYFIFQILSLLSVIAYVIWEQPWMLGIVCFPAALVCSMIVISLADDVESLESQLTDIRRKLQK